MLFRSSIVMHSCRSSACACIFDLLVHVRPGALKAPVSDPGAAAFQEVASGHAEWLCLTASLRLPYGGRTELASCTAARHGRASKRDHGRAAGHFLPRGRPAIWQRYQGRTHRTWPHSRCLCTRDPSQGIETRRCTAGTHIQRLRIFSFKHATVWCPVRPLLSCLLLWRHVHHECSRSMRDSKRARPRSTRV